MAKRGDSSEFVYHWIKSTTSPQAELQEKYEDAFATLLLILADLALKSGRALGKRYGHSCICFTETPVWFISDDKSKYQPFGFEFCKKEIYRIGGEHVIYCSEERAKLLPQEHLWTWMKHEPLLRNDKTPYGVDFTWEREIRVNRSEIELIGPSDLANESSLNDIKFAFNRIYVPSLVWKEKLLIRLKELLNDRLIKVANEVDELEYAWLEAFYGDMLSEYEFNIDCIS